MSYMVGIYQKTVTRRFDGQQEKIIHIADNYGSGYISLDEYSDNFYDDTLELFENILWRIKEGKESEQVVQIIDYIYEHEESVFIDGEFYEYKELALSFEKVNYFGE